MSYICLSCHQLFDEPCEYAAYSDLENGPVEHCSVSPCCHDDYDKAVACDRCGAAHPASLTRPSNSPFSDEGLCPACYRAEEDKIDAYLDYCGDIGLHINAVSPRHIRNQLNNERS